MRTRKKTIFWGLIIWLLVGCEPIRKPDPDTTSPSLVPYFVAYLLVTHNSDVYDFVDPSLHNEIRQWLQITQSIKKCNKPVDFGATHQFLDEKYYPDKKIFHGQLGLSCRRGMEPSHLSNLFMFTDPIVELRQDGDKKRWILASWDTIFWNRDYPKGEYPELK